MIGCPGGGKSTFTRALSQKTGLPTVHLDLLFWNKDRTTVERDVFLARLERVLQKEAWIIDGNYASTMERRMQESDTVIFLDYSQELCLEGIRARRGKQRADLPWIETEEDEEFLAYVKAFSAEGRPQILQLLEKYPEKKIIVFKNRKEAEEFLEKEEI